MNFRTILSLAKAFSFLLIPNLLLAQNVGIATSTPIAPLNVAHGKTVVFGYDSIPGNPIESMGTLTWFPNKGALRYLWYEFGGSIGTEWNPANIGVNSLGIGQYCVASGPQSFVQGYGSSATGSYSLARGFAAVATGSFSFAEGNATYANGNFSFSHGNFNYANADNSFAFGAGIINTGQFSTVFGLENHSKSYGALVIGRYNDSINTSSGNSWVNTDPILIAGNGTGNNSRSNSFIVLKNGSTGIGVNQPSAYFHVAQDKTVLFGNDSTSGTAGNKFVWFGTKSALRFGKINTPSSSPWDYANIGESSLGIGDVAQASGYNSFAQGFGATASASYSMARGFAVSATSDFSFAMGSSTTAVGPFAFGFGANLRPVAMWSTSFGNGNTSNGQYSTTFGSDLHAKALNCFVIGRFNDSINTSSNTTWVDTDPLFLIGNGTSNVARKNAVTVLKNGKVGIGITPVYEFEVTHISGSQGNMGFAIRNTNPGGSNHRWSHYVSNGTGDYLLHFNGNLRGTFDDVTGDYTSVSDARLKSEITSIGSVLDDVLQLNPSSYYFKSESHRDAKHFGFIAQEVEKLFPSMVKTPNEEQEFYTLDYSGFSVLAIRAIQEQQEIIKKQQSKIDELEKRLKAIEDRLR